MSNCRCGDDRRICVGGQFFKRSEDAASRRRRASRVGIENTRQSGIGRLLNYAKVIAAERAGSNDGNAGCEHQRKAYHLHRVMARNSVLLG